MGAFAGKSLSQKIDLFIQIADTHGLGTISEDEVKSLCKYCLSRFTTDDELLITLTNFITQKIYAATKTKPGKEVELQTIKDLILNEHEDAEMLKMFCCVDV